MDIFINNYGRKQFQAKNCNVQHLSETLGALLRMPGQFTITIDCDNKGEFINPNRVIGSNSKVKFKKVSFDTIPMESI